MNLAMLPLLLLLIECATVASVQFTIASGPCPGGKGAFQACDETIHACMCGSAPDTDRQWCCGPKQAECYSWGLDCTGAQGLAGEGQIYCTGYSNKWCCNSQYEKCTTLEGQSNICLTNFQNPYHDVSPDTASSLKVAFFASTSSLTLSSTTTTSRTSLSVQTSSTSASIESTKDVPTTTSLLEAAPKSSSSLSGGAIAGIVIGVVAVLALVAVGSFFFGRRRHRDRQEGVVSNREELPADETYTKAELSGAPRRVELPAGKF